MKSFLITLSLAALLPSLAAKSLWTTKQNSEAGMYADRTANAIGDIVMVKIEEEVVVNRTTSKSSSSNANLALNFGDLVLPHIVDIRSSDTDAPRAALSPQSSSSGSGSVADANVIEAAIAVMVVDVQPNGNLLIEGARKIKSNGEGQYLVVRGIIRADDLMPDNSIKSEYVLNASIELLNEGDLKNAQTKGWLHRLLDVTNIL